MLTAPGLEMGKAGYAPELAYNAEALEHIRRDWDEEGPGVQGGHWLMYHERISRDARVWLTRPADQVSWSCRGANGVAYNVCVDAGPSSGTTGAQMEALAARLRCLVPVLLLSMVTVWDHGELKDYGNRTECPGDRVRDLCRRFRRGRCEGCPLSMREYWRFR